eukprot:Partr_v1_DN25973_c1_g1_i5_m68484 putative IMP-specific 5'-nucleotidase involved in IMP (inositol monophosphate) degradation (By similarity)
MSSRYSNNYYLRSHKRDQFIEFIKSLLLTPFILSSSGSAEQQNLDNKVISSNLDRYLDVLKHLETLIEDHRHISAQGHSHRSRLLTIVPSIGQFFTPLPLVSAFKLVNARFMLTARRFVPPSFNDIRRILNCAQTMAVANDLRLITFDGDVTLYEDGANLLAESPLCRMMVQLLEMDIYVAIVTAAGYTDPEKYEVRLSGLLEYMRGSRLTETQMARLFVVGGECNYFMRLGTGCKLIMQDFAPPYTVSDENIKVFLDLAEQSLRMCQKSMNLHAQIIRKDKAVGLISIADEKSRKLEREQLDECVLYTQERLREGYLHNSILQTIPFCAFNGGTDAWIDVGDKLLGVQSLQKIISSSPSQTLHVGDQFLSTGNDFATRSACCTLWITSPAETLRGLEDLLQFRTV